MFCKSHQLGPWGRGEGEGDAVGRAVTAVLRKGGNVSPGRQLAGRKALQMGELVPGWLGEDKDTTAGWEDDKASGGKHGARAEIPGKELRLHIQERKRGRKR